MQIVIRQKKEYEVDDDSHLSIVCKLVSLRIELENQNLSEEYETIMNFSNRAITEYVNKAEVKLGFHPIKGDESSILIYKTQLDGLLNLKCDFETAAKDFGEKFYNTLSELAETKKDLPYIKDLYSYFRELFKSLEIQIPEYAK